MSALRFADLTGPAAGLRGPQLVAVQPIGSVEHHGPHLPLVTDSLITEATALAVAQARPDLPLAVLPVISYALSTEHVWAPGTISLSPATILSVADDLGRSLARAGVPRLVFLNGHGGNSALLQVACREIRVNHGLQTFLVHPHLPVDQGGEASSDVEGDFAIHDSARETSVVMYLRPDLVNLELAERCIPEWMASYNHVGFGSEASFGWTSRDVTPSGVIGDPTQATEEAGKEAFEGGVERLGDVFDEICRFTYPT